MHVSICAHVTRIAASFAAALVLVAAGQPAAADVPLPIIDIVPQALFASGADIILPQKSSGSSIQSGELLLGGTVTIPLFKSFSVSYDHVVGKAYDTPLSLVYINMPIQTQIAPAQDVVQNYRADYHIGMFNIEGGFATRDRFCCPGEGDGAQGVLWRKGFLGVSYATPHYAFLNHGFFVFDITANSSKHFSSPQALASIDDPGLSLPNNSQVYTTQQAVTAIIPVDLKHGVRTAATFLWGALDYPVNGPFPYYYDVFIFAATKQVNNTFGVTADVTNVTQRTQGFPFPAGQAIHTNAFYLSGDIHLDFHRLFPGSAARPSPGRPTTPGTPGGPGGAAPISPSQGGAVPSPVQSPPT